MFFCHSLSLIIGPEELHSDLTSDLAMRKKKLSAGKNNERLREKFGVERLVQRAGL